MKILSLFSGIGAFEKALENLNVQYELVNYCEIDKYASKAFSLIHHLDENLNLGDITKVETNNFPKDIDVVTYGFPCQDISTAGKQRGFTDEKGNTTRSGLFFEALRIIDELTKTYKENQRSNVIGDLVMEKWQESMKRIYDINSIAPTINTYQGGNLEPKILCERRIDEGLRFFKDGVCGTLRTIDGCGDKRVIEMDKTADNPLSAAPTIRKITPRECFRLMGFDDTDFNVLQKNKFSNTQLYKMAGNSIVVNVLEYLYTEIFEQYKDAM